MSDKTKGIYKKYEVKKLTNPSKKIDCIVLEFDDPIARQGIRSWAHTMLANGYVQVAAETLTKIDIIEKDIMMKTLFKGLK